MKAILKRSYILVSIVRSLRKAPALLATGALHRILGLANASVKNKRLLYFALHQDFAYAQHKDESYLVPTGDDYIGPALFSRGVFDFSKFERACKIILSSNSLRRPTKPLVLIDVGANLGSICIPAIKRGYISSAIAVEPDAQNARLLKINAILNNVESLISVVEAAVGDEQGSVALSRSDTNSGAHSTSENADHTSEIVPLISLDSLALKTNVEATIIWMDIQGFEGFAFKGGRIFSKSAVPWVFEFDKGELVQAGCYEILLDEVLQSDYNVFYDLDDPDCTKHTLSREALSELADKLSASKSFTDILLLKE